MSEGQLSHANQHPLYLVCKLAHSQQTQNICITCMLCYTNVLCLGLYEWYTNVLWPTYIS